MLPVTFPEQNFAFTKPQSMTDEQCMTLPACICELQIDEVGTKELHVVSCWQLSKEDLEEINRTGRIYHASMGVGVIPFMLTTENPCK